MKKYVSVWLEQSAYNARYPVVKQKLAGSLDKKECERLLKNTKDIIEWLREK